MPHPLYTERPWWSLIWITDMHVSSVGPMSRRDDYEASILDKLNQVNIIANAINVDRLICGGDVFHHRSPAKTSHETIQRMIDLWKDHVPLGIVGNHDLAWNNETFLDRQPLGVLIKAGVYQLVSSNPVRVGPFLIGGINFQEELIEKSRWQIPDDNEDMVTLRILLLHQLASPDGQSPMQEVTYSYDLISRRTNADVVCIGHWHEDQGVQKQVAETKLTGYTHIVNTGSLARTSRSQDSINNSRKCVLIRFNTETKELQIHQIKLRSRPAAEIFDLEAAKRQRQHEVNFQSFLDQLGSKTDFTFDVEELIKKSTDDKQVAELGIRLFREAQQQKT